MDTILGEARAKAESIRQDADAKAKQALEAEQSAMRNFLAENAAKDEADGQDLVTKATTAAVMEGKKALLATKREVLDTVYSRLADRLYGLGHDDYLALVNTLLERYATEGDTVLMAKGCAIDYGEVQSLAVSRRLALRVEYGEGIKGGIKLVGSAMDKDLTFEALCHSLQSSTEMDLAIRLFAN